MNIPTHRIFDASSRLFALTLALTPVALHAQSVLPLHIGFYSSASCNDPPNAALLHFDGQNLNGAHSASCHDEVSRLGTHAYRVKQSCPAEQQGNGSAAYPTSASRQLSVTSAVSFTLITEGDANPPVRYRFCGRTLTGASSPKP